MAARPASAVAPRAVGFAEPGRDCPLCSRLLRFRQTNRETLPDFHNAPVPSFGDPRARLLIVGLAPGLKGANRTGRPFTGDYAGDLLYETLRGSGFAEGIYGRRADDGLALIGCRITNAVRCVPPQNKPIGAEVTACRRFLKAEIESLSELRGILALGGLAHGAVLSALDLVRSRFPFRHGAIHELPATSWIGHLWLADSYHCSRYNTNTGRLTGDMFEAVFAGLRARLNEGPG